MKVIIMVVMNMIALVVMIQVIIMIMKGIVERTSIKIVNGVKMDQTRKKETVVMLVQLNILQTLGNLVIQIQVKMVKK